MTSATQIAGPGSGSAPGFGASAVFRPGSIRGDEREEDRRPIGIPGRDEPTREADALPGRNRPPEPGTAPSTSDVVRLPGQEGPSDGGLRRPLITGGAFTLAVAIGLSLDQQAQPDSLARSTPSSNGQDAAAPESEGAVEEGIDGLTEEEREQVQELQQRDAEVRRHEAAHAAAGGQYAGAPSFTYQTGPDGKRYAVGGEVSIDTSPIKGDPEATIRKAQQIRAAANAPADPSSQDRRVAAQADSLRQQAQAELTAQRREERQAEEAEAAAAEAERAAQEETSQANTQPTVQAPAAPSNDDTSFGVTPADGGFGPRETPSAAASSASVPGGPDDGVQGAADASQPFGPAAFSDAAASYRGFSPTPRLVSIAV